jgi:hypothetical protein
MKARRAPSRGTWFRRSDAEGAELRRILARELSPHEIKALGTWHWEVWGRDEQNAPKGPCR